MADSNLYGKAYSSYEYLFLGEEAESLFINFTNDLKAIGWNQFNVVKKENSQGFWGLNQTFLGPDHIL